MFTKKSKLDKGKDAQKNQKKSINDGFCVTHAYIQKNPSFFGFFPRDGEKFSIKTMVEKRTK